MLISVLKEAANGSTTLSMEQLLADFQRNFRNRIVMLFVSTFLLSCDKSFINGDIFNRAIHICDADEWEKFKR